MFEDIIKKETQDQFYKIFDYGNVFLDFKNKTIELKGKLTESDLVKFKYFIDNKYGKFVMTDLCFTEKWKWVSNGIRARGYFRELLEYEHRN